MPRLRAVAVAVLSSLVVSAAASSAFADAASSGARAPIEPGCFVSVLAAGTTSLPSNAPALILIDTSRGGAEATVTAELVSGAARVAFVGPTKDTHGLTVLKFANPSAGAHTIATKVSCSTGNDTSVDTPIVLTAPVPFPTSVGTLVAQQSSTQTGFADIVVEASPELRAFLPVSVMTMKVNDGPPRTLNNVQAGSSSVRFNAHTGFVCVENGSLHREKRTVKVSVSADIAGVADSPAAATLDVVVDCGAIRWTSASDFESAKDGTTTPVTSPGATPTNATGGTDAGCTAAPVGTLSGNAAALVAGALAVVAGLRRRRRAA